MIFIFAGAFLTFKYFSNVFDYKSGKDVTKVIEKNIQESEKNNSKKVKEVRMKIKSMPFKYIIDNGNKFL